MNAKTLFTRMKDIALNIHAGELVLINGLTLVDPRLVALYWYVIQLSDFCIYSVFHGMTFDPFTCNYKLKFVSSLP